jgi:hypothetical protein
MMRFVLPILKLHICNNLTIFSAMLYYGMHIFWAAKFNFNSLSGSL